MDNKKQNHELNKNMLKKMTNLYIRVDATLAMGTGHIMRCIALAQAWKKKGGQVTFISHCKNKTIRQRIESEGFEFIAIERPCPAPQDLEQTLDILDKNNSVEKNMPNTLGWMVLDGYHFTENYQQSIQKSKSKLLVIDDYHHLKYYYADIILNQNIHADNYSYTCHSDTIKLLGLKYTLLRSEFLTIKTIKNKSPKKAKKILITMGGSDPGNATLKIIHALQSINDSELAIKVVVGSSNPHLGKLKNSLQLKPCNIRLIYNADMPSIITWSDLAISAGGSTCWELLYLRVPFITIVLAENQEENTSFLESKGVTINCGPIQFLRSKTLAEQICAIMKSKKLRDQLLIKGSLLIDGLGAKRIIQQMETLT